jgi:MYXO-CTERM domain-containing protein
LDGQAEFGMIDLMTRSMKTDSFTLPAGQYLLSFHLDSRTDTAGGAESLDFGLRLLAIPEPTAWALGLTAVAGLVLGRWRRRGPDSRSR